MDVDLPQRSVPGVDELVGHASRSHHYLAGAHFYGVISDGEGSITLQRYEDLLVRMGVQYRSTAGRAVHQEERHVHIAVAVSLEPVRDLAIREIVLVDYVNHGLLSVGSRHAGLIARLATCSREYRTEDP